MSNFFKFGDWQKQKEIITKEIEKEEMLHRGTEILIWDQLKAKLIGTLTEKVEFEIDINESKRLNKMRKEMKWKSAGLW
jgi:hypothetical protein